MDSENQTDVDDLFQAWRCKKRAQIRAQLLDEYSDLKPATADNIAEYRLRCFITEKIGAMLCELGDTEA